MNWLDLVLLVLIGVAAMIGFRAGLLMAASTLVGTLVGITIASRYGDDAGSVFSSLTDNENVQEIAGFLLVLLLVLAAAAVMGTVLKKVLHTFMLGWVDQLGGLALWAIIAMAAASALLANLQDFPVLSLDSTIADSTVGSFLADNFDVVLRGVRILPRGFGT